MFMIDYTMNDARGKDSKCIYEFTRNNFYMVDVTNDTKILFIVSEERQGSRVELVPLHHKLKKASYPKSYLVTKVCHERNNLDRNIKGRQLILYGSELVFVSMITLVENFDNG